MSEPSPDQVRILLLESVEKLGRHGLEPTEEAMEALTWVIANASVLGAAVDARAQKPSKRVPPPLFTHADVEVLGGALWLLKQMEADPKVYGVEDRGLLASIRDRMLAYVEAAAPATEEDVGGRDAD